MLFTSKPQLILHLRRNELALYDDKQLINKAVVPPEVVTNLEVLDAAKLSELAASLLTEVKGQRIMLVLDAGVVFQATIKTKEVKSAAEAKTEFNDALPLRQADKAIVVLESEKQYFLFATNMALLQPLVEAITAADNKAMAAVPSSVFGLDEEASLTAKMLKDIFDNIKLISLANFLAE